MNVERLEKLAETVEPGFHQFGDIILGFNMSTYFCADKESPCHLDADWKGCDALGCLVAFTILLFTPEMITKPDVDLNDDNREIEAGLLLGLPGDKAHELFFGSMSPNTTGADAARVIRRFIQTGEVDWLRLELQPA